MASLNKVVTLPVPIGGVRADLDEMAVPANALVVAKNVISINGALEPRPGHSALAIASPWRFIFTGSNLHDVAKKPLSVVAVSGRDEIYTTMDGDEWETHDLGTTNVDFNRILCAPANPEWRAVTSNNHYWRAPVTWPNLGAWADKGVVVSAGSWEVLDLAWDTADDYLLACVYQSGSGINQVMLCENPSAATPTWTNVLFTNGNARCTHVNGYWIVVSTNGEIKRAPSTTGISFGSWSSVGPGTANLTFMDLATDGAAQVLAVGTYGGGTVVYKSDNGGSTWGQIPEATIAGKTAASIARGPGDVYLVVTDRSPAPVETIDGAYAVVVRDSLPSAACYRTIHTGLGHWISVCTGAVYSHQRWDDRPIGVVQYSVDQESNAIVMGSAGGLRHYDPENAEWDDVTPLDVPLRGYAGTSMVFRRFMKGNKTWILGTNGVDPPIVWHPSLAMYRRILGSPPTAKAMAILNNRVMLGNLTSGSTVSPQAIDVSSLNDFDSGWGTVAVALLGDTGGEIVSIDEIDSGRAVVFFDDAIHHAVENVEFQGQLAPFRFDTIVVGIPGPCSPRCVQRIDGIFTYLGRDGGLYTYDGNHPQDVGIHIRRLVQPQFDENSVSQAWGFYDQARRLLWYFYPSVTSGMSQGIVVVTDRGQPWPVYEVILPASWEAAAGMPCFLRTDITIGDLDDQIGTLDTSIGDWASLDRQMMMLLDDGTAKLQKWTDDGTFDDDGTPINVLWQPGFSPLSAGHEFVTLHEFHQTFTEMGSGDTFAVTAKGKDQQGADISSGPVNIVTATPYRKSSHRLTARYFTMSMAAAVSNHFRWHNTAAFFQIRGRR